MLVKQMVGKQRRLVERLLLKRAVLVMELTDGWRHVLFSEDMKFSISFTLSPRILFWQAKKCEI